MPLAANPPPAQRARHHPEGGGRHDDSSLFRTGMVWATRNRPVPSLDPRGFARITTDGLGQ